MPIIGRILKVELDEDGLVTRLLVDPDNLHLGVITAVFYGNYGFQKNTRVALYYKGKEVNRTGTTIETIRYEILDNKRNNSRVLYSGVVEN